MPPSQLKRKPRKRSIKPKGEPSISKLMKEADRLFSIKVRHQGATLTEMGLMNRCYTCKNIFEVRRLHAGHYVSRMFKAARWHEDNSRPQCYACNIYRKGDAAKFRLNLVLEIGTARVEAVERLRDADMKLTREYLEALIKQLQSNATPTPYQLKQAA